MYTPIYFHAKQGSLLPGPAMSDHFARVDYITLEDGDHIGKMIARTGQCRRILEGMEGIVVLPPLHRPIQAHHAARFKHIKAVEGEVGYDIAERLHAKHEVAWMHPEEFFL
jgi:hypothetical protein